MGLLMKSNSRITFTYLFVSVFLLLIALVLPVLATDEQPKFIVQFDNNSNELVYYHLYWISHPFGGSAWVNMAGGELAAKSSWRPGGSFRNGTYFIQWSDREKVLEWDVFVHTNSDGGVRYLSYPME